MAENTKSATYQMRWRSIWAEMLNAIDPGKTGGVTLPYYLLAIKNFFDTVETKEEDKETVKIFNDMTMMIARLKLVVEASGAQTKLGQDTLMNAQVDMQLQQIWQALQASQMQQAQPVGHMEEPVQSRQISYPQINPQPAEAVPSGATPPAMTGAPV